jgi:hypothetical protein
MTAIAAVALVLGACIELPRLHKLSLIYRRRAESHASLEQQTLYHLGDERECLAFWSALADQRRKSAETPGAPRPDAVESWAELASQAREQASWHAKLVSLWDSKAQYHARMRQKWQRSARYPWISAEMDTNPPYAGARRGETAADQADEVNALPGFHAP